VLLWYNNKYGTSGSNMNLNQRIEDLIITMEKRFSYKASFMRGIAQGLGFIIGSTIVAGVAYTILTTFFVSSKMLNDITIESAVERGLKK
jgi:hypothetical protein